jgi:hypothetical protein
MKTTKKAQFEIMGLAIVVILISLIVLFVVRFVVLKEPTDLRKEYTEFDISYSFVNTLMNTNVPDCYGLSFTELFKDCESSLIVNCGGITSCSYIKETLPNILNQSLGIQNLNYEFTAYRNNDESDIIIDPVIKGGCPTYRKSAPQPISSGGQIILLNLYVC